MLFLKPLKLLKVKFKTQKSNMSYDEKINSVLSQPVINPLVYTTGNNPLVKLTAHHDLRQHQIKHNPFRHPFHMVDVSP